MFQVRIFVIWTKDIGEMNTYWQIILAKLLKMWTDL